MSGSLCVFAYIKGRKKKDDNGGEFLILGLGHGYQENDDHESQDDDEINFVEHEVEAVADSLASQCRVRRVGTH